MISQEEIKKIAELSRIKVLPEEEETLTNTITQILSYMDILKEVDTSDVEITSQVTGLRDVTREDKPVKSPIREELIKNMPEVYADELSVPGVFDK